MEFGRAGWLGKARQQPDKVRQVLDKVRTDGIVSTWQSVSNRLEQALPLGYCNASVVVDGDPSVLNEFGLTIGSRVVSNSPHADFFCTTPTCCAVIPDQVANNQASFTVLGAVGLQGVRLANPTIGEYFAVIGLGLIGLMTVQILLANGCRVIGLDIDKDKCDLAKSYGAHAFLLDESIDPIPEILSITNGRLLDGVLITAATSSNKLISDAAAMCRKRGRIILVGITGLNLKRSDFYEKELSFQVSCAYGPGRYDPNYEKNGNDYPVAYVRWTMKRNFEAVLDLISDNKINTSSLITHTIDFINAPDAFEVLSKGESHLGIILKYQDDHELNQVISLPTDVANPLPSNHPIIGVIGAGLFASTTLLPILSKYKSTICSIVSRQGSNAALCARRFKITNSYSNEDNIWSDNNINTVFILTRHDLHAEQVQKAFKSGRNVYLEKPLCLTFDELQLIKESYKDAIKTYPNLVFMVGFNRRFAPLTIQLNSILKTIKGPKSFIMTVNAGFLPAEHWLLNPEIGGGRIVGEGIHFIDLIMHLADSQLVCANILTDNNNSSPQSAIISLKFQDGSLGSIHYLSNGHKSYPKERLEVFCGGKVIQLDNFNKLRFWGIKHTKNFFNMTFSQDKGHSKSVSAFLNAIERNLPSPVSADEIWSATRVTLSLSKNNSWHFTDDQQ